MHQGQGGTDSKTQQPKPSQHEQRHSRVDRTTGSKSEQGKKPKASQKGDPDPSDPSSSSSSSDSTSSDSEEEGSSSASDDQKSKSKHKNRKTKKHGRCKDTISFGAWRTKSPDDSDDEITKQSSIIKKSKSLSRYELREGHDFIKPPRMGHKGVNSKILKHYGDMTDGGRTYDRAGSSKNKMGLKHLLKITKHIIQEYKLHDEAAYTLFRKALTGKALESSILMEDNGTSFPHFFISLQMLNNVQDNKNELQIELAKLKGCLLYTSPSPRD